MSAHCGRPPGWIGRSAPKCSKTGKQVRLATTQQHWSIRDHEKNFDQLQKRGIIREVTREQFQEHPEIVQHMDIHVPTAGQHLRRALVRGSAAVGPVDRFDEVRWLQCVRHGLSEREQHSACRPR